MKAHILFLFEIELFICIKMNLNNLPNIPLNQTKPKEMDHEAAWMGQPIVIVRNKLPPLYKYSSSRNKNNSQQCHSLKNQMGFMAYQPFKVI